MKYISVLIAIVFLSGCSMLPQKKPFPDIPEKLLTPCPELMRYKNSEKLTDLLKTTTHNNIKHRECREKSLLFIEWYIEQKKIYNKK